jgi:hypothetical protein
MTTRVITFRDDETLLPERIRNVYCYMTLDDEELTKLCDLLKMANKYINLANDYRYAVVRYVKGESLDDCIKKLGKYKLDTVRENSVFYSKASDEEIGRLTEILEEAAKNAKKEDAFEDEYADIQFLDFDGSVIPSYIVAAQKRSIMEHFPPGDAEPENNEEDVCMGYLSATLCGFYYLKNSETSLYRYVMNNYKFHYNSYLIVDAAYEVHQTHPDVGEFDRYNDFIKKLHALPFGSREEAVQ